MPIDVSCIEGVRFHINLRCEQPVEILLQRMFPDEFDITKDDILAI